MDGHHNKFSRRHFLKASACALAMSGMVTSCGKKAPLEAKASQTANKRKEPSPVSITKCESYEEDVYKLLKETTGMLDLPDFRNKSVLIKPNMVDYNPSKPLTTNTAVLTAAIALVDSLGAKEIIIGEGPAHHRDIDLLLETSGIGALCKKLGVPFVDLNLDDLEGVENKDNFSGVNVMYMPKTLTSCDAVVSVPKLKTHHWARMTASMKNLFGTVPGRKYGWPKNMLHIRGIDEFILDLTRITKPAFALVDGVVAMEGDGPLNGTAVDSHFLVLGTDLAAVDATCARAMGMEVQQIPYLRVAGSVIGNTDEANIKLVGAPLSSVARKFQPAPTFTPEGKRLLERLQEEADSGDT